MYNKSRLGRGIESLIPTNIINESSNFVTLNIADIKVNPYQPRKVFSEEDIIELSESIKQHGLTQPIIVEKRTKLMRLLQVKDG